MPRAIVVTGVGSQYPDEVVQHLESEGYDVEVYRYYDLNLPSSGSLNSDDLVWGHSAGGTRVQTQYQGSKAEVVSYGAPTRLGGGRVKHVSNSWDPVTWLSGNIPSFSKRGLDAHNFTTYLDNSISQSQGDPNIAGSKRGGKYRRKRYPGEGPEDYARRLSGKSQYMRNQQQRYDKLMTDRKRGGTGGVHGSYFQTHVSSQTRARMARVGGGRRRGGN